MFYLLFEQRRQDHSSGSSIFEPTNIVELEGKGRG